MYDDGSEFRNEATGHVFQWIARSGGLVNLQALLNRAEQLSRGLSSDKTMGEVQSNLAGLLEEVVNDTFVKWRTESIRFYQPTAYLSLYEVGAWNERSVVEFSRSEDLFIPLIGTAADAIDYDAIAKALLIREDRWHEPGPLPNSELPGDDEEAENSDAISTRRSRQKDAQRRRNG